MPKLFPPMIENHCDVKVLEAIIMLLTVDAYRKRPCANQDSPAADLLFTKLPCSDELGRVVFLIRGQIVDHDYPQAAFTE